jgi:hypothetical protein
MSQDAVSWAVVQLSAIGFALVTVPVFYARLEVVGRVLGVVPALASLWPVLLTGRAQNGLRRPPAPTAGCSSSTPPRRRERPGRDHPRGASWSPYSPRAAQVAQHLGHRDAAAVYSRDQRRPVP